MQEVNAMLEPKKSELILQKTKELENAEVAASNPTNFTRRSSNTASVKRSSKVTNVCSWKLMSRQQLKETNTLNFPHNFWTSLLYKWNSILISRC